MYTASTDRWFATPLLVLLATSLCACATGPTVPEAGAVMDPAVEANFNAAMSAASEGRTERAETMLSGISDSHPELVAPQLNLAILYADTGREAESERLLLTLLESNPDEPEAWNQLGVLRRRSGRFQEADEAYMAALQVDRDYAPVHRNRGVLLDLYLGRPGEAIEHYRRFVRLTEGDDEVERWIAELELRLERAGSQKVAER